MNAETAPFETTEARSARQVVLTKVNRNAERMLGNVFFLLLYVVPLKSGNTDVIH